MKNAPARGPKNEVKVDLKFADEAVLLSAVLRSDEKAWREFVRRFDPVVRHQIGRVIARYVRSVLSNDSFDDLLGDFYLSLLNNNMAKLRAYDSTRGSTLASWLGLLATRSTLNQMRRPFRDAEFMEPLESFDENDPQRGARWIAEGL